MPSTIRDVIATPSLRSAVPGRAPEPAPAPGPARPRLRLTDGTGGHPACESCRGLGCYRLDVPPGHAYFGKLIECECAAERRSAAQTSRLQQASALDPSDLALTWGSIADNAAVRPAITTVRHTLMRGHGWVYLWGPPGPGKTLVLKTAVAESLRAGTPAVFVVWADLLNHLRQGYAAGDYDRRLEAWRTAPVLAVDEFGRAKESEWVREARVLVFNHRYEAAAGRHNATLFSSNHAPEQSEPWFADRLLDGRFFVQHMDGPSMRPLMEWE